MEMTSYEYAVPSWVDLTTPEAGRAVEMPPVWSAYFMFDPATRR